MSLQSRFTKLRTGVGGFREKKEFEYSFGMPIETQMHIVRPGKPIRRILSEMDFALRLSDAQGGAFDADIDRALTILENGMETEAVLNRSVCEEAEKALLTISTAAKEYTVLLAGHAHIDMNWMWGWQETVAITLSTFRTVLKLMAAYPQFTFSQSQASVYKIVERFDPEMMEEIRRRIMEGRWEVTASAWVETDKNMPNTESLLRHIRQTRDYLQKTWGLDPNKLEVDFSPDTFGHSANIPEIDCYGGVKYMYHCRGLAEAQLLYRWRAPSGQEILAYCEPYWYNGAVTPDAGIAAVDLSKRSAGLKTSLWVYGVGDHGGGPTRRDIETALEMMEWPVFPVIRFGGFHEFFHAAEAVRSQLPVFDREINFVMTGCYTTQSRIKLGNRHSEAAMLDAEAADASAGALLPSYQPYPKEKLDEAWRNILFTHFHDILTGSCVQETREHAMGLYADVLATANTAREKALRAVADHIDTSGIAVDDAEYTQSEGAGVGFGIEWYDGVPNPETGRGKTRVYHIFNPSPWERTETTEFTVWDWTGDTRRAEVTDPDGNVLPFTWVDKKYQRYWDHQYYRFHAEVTVPAFGYATIVLREREAEMVPIYNCEYPRTDVLNESLQLENEQISARFDAGTGRLISLIDKKTGREQVKTGCQAGLSLVYAEKRTNDAWHIGRHLTEEPVNKTISITPLPTGFELEQRILNSTVKTTVTLDANASRLAYAFDIDWHEYAKDKENVPVLTFALPLGQTPDAFVSDVPGGAVRRAQGRHDIPALQYTAAAFDERTLAFVSDCKYGYRAWEDVLSITLINSAGNPDPYPERGRHKIKLWLALADNAPKALHDAAFDCCHPLRVLSGGIHKGDLPNKAQFLKIKSEGVVLSSVSGSLLCRLYETSGRDSAVELELPFDISGARSVDLNGEPLGLPVAVAGRHVSLTIPAHRIVGLEIQK